MFFKDYSEVGSDCTSSRSGSLDSESRTILISEPEIQFKIPVSILKNAGDVFGAMIDGHFQESTMTNINLSNELQLNEVTWETYFDLVANITTIDEVSMNTFHYLLIISDYLANLNLYHQLKDLLETKISEEPLVDYLNNWIYYFQIYTWFGLDSKIPITESDYHLVYKDDISESKSNSGLSDSGSKPEPESNLDSGDFFVPGLLTHFECRLSLINYKIGLSALFKNGRDMLEFIKEYPEYFDEFLDFFIIWWRCAGHIFTENRYPANPEIEQETLRNQASNLADAILFDPFINFENCFKYTPINIKKSAYYDPIRNSTIVSEKQNFVPGEATIIKSSEWSTRWQNLTYGLLDDINWDNLILAGGAVYKILNPKIMTFGPGIGNSCNDAFWIGPQTDLDLFLIGDEDTQRAKLDELLTWFLLKYTDDLYIGMKRSVIYLWIRGIPRNIQIISSKAKTPLEILSQFDLSHTQMAYNGNESKILLTPMAMFSLNTRYSIQLNSWHIPSITRVIKALNSGYNLVVDESRVRKYLNLSMVEKSRMREKLFYNYFIPYSKTGLAKNCWELKNHYKLPSIWVGEAIKITEIISKTEIASGFRRGYDESEFKQTVVDPLKIDWEQIRLKIIRHPDALFLFISYDECPLIWNLPKMTINYVNQEMYSDEATKNNRILCFNLSQVELELFEHLDDQFIDKVYNLPQIGYRPQTDAIFHGLVKYTKNSKCVSNSQAPKFEDQYDPTLPTYFRVTVTPKVEIVNALTGEISNDPKIFDNLWGHSVKIQGIFKYVWASHRRDSYSLKVHPTKITYFPNSKQLRSVLIQS